MIAKQDIIDRAAEWQLRVDIVEKDYVLGWLLAALGAHSIAGPHWVFKGGTCIKKCYLETYRFSEDLDFSLLQDASYTEEELHGILQSVAGSASDMSGIAFPPDRVKIRSRLDKQGRATFEGTIYYRGPLDTPEVARVLFDITKHEPVLAHAERRCVSHPYPDSLPDGAAVTAYSLPELLAEKLRALYERARPRDLYDVVYLLENKPDAFELPRVRELFAGKCAAKGIETPSTDRILEVVQNDAELRSEWENMLAHQLPVLPKLGDLLGRLPDLLRWIDVPMAAMPLIGLRQAPLAATETIVAPPSIQYWGSGAPLETIRFAGANRLLLEFTYDGRHRRVEPYSLRRAQTGNLLFYGWEEGSDHIKAFNTALMADVRATNTSFQPRYRIEFTSFGPIVAPETAQPIRVSAPYSGVAPRSRSSYQTRYYGPTYVFECPFCNKKFRHSKNDSTLRKHKAKDGYWDCLGRTGYLVSME
jgi:predicted nucleotidyltransferase component of viral defense system